MQIIGINGFKRSGKNTVGNCVAAIRPNVTQVAFADKLKIAAARALGFDRTPDDLIALMDSFKEVAVFNIRYLEPGKDTPCEHTLTGRQYLQWMGTEAGRYTFADEFWVDLVLPDEYLDYTPAARRHALGELYPRSGPDGILVVTDVRFENEALRIKRLGGTMWEVIRPGVDGGTHASERPLPRHLVDDVIHNDAGLEKLEDAADHLLRRLAC